MVTHALTFVQPWASAVLLCGKSEENRPWVPTAQHLGQRIAVHAGKKFDKSDAWGLLKRLPQFDLSTAPCGVIMGTVEIAGWVRFEMRPSAQVKFVLGDVAVRDSVGLTAAEVKAVAGSPWRAPDSPCVWVLRKPLVLPGFIPCAGALGLWRIPVEARERINAGLSAQGATT